MQIYDKNHKSENQAVKLFQKQINGFYKNFRSPSVYNRLQKSSSYLILSKKVF
jgi:hypothetical protein